MDNVHKRLIPSFIQHCQNHLESYINLALIMHTDILKIDKLRI
jgi:hypothetical protein